MLRTQQRGFTLIEIAIVLVIIGLLLGGVLKGQELITSARVRNLIAQQDGIKAAFFGFQDRFRAMPGDYATAATTLKCPNGDTCLNGNGNGIIEAPATVTTGEAHEEILAWMHLASAGFLNGSYQMEAGATEPNEQNNPRNPYNIHLRFSSDNNYFDTSAPPIQKLNLKTGSQIPVEIISEVDRKIDDGHAQRGSFRFSRYNGPTDLTGLGVPAGTGTGACVNSDNQTWFISEGQSNCGGTSLF